MITYLPVGSFLCKAAIIATCVLCGASGGVAAHPLATDTVRSDERAFLREAIARSHEQGRLAELGSSNATNSDVRSHAQQLKSDYRQMVDALDALMRRKSAVTRPVPPANSEIYLKLAAQTGADFDHAFVRAMAELHRETITLFEQAAAESKDADVREFAASQLPVLRAHLNGITQLKSAFE